MTTKKKQAVEESGWTILSFALTALVVIVANALGADIGKDDPYVIATVAAIVKGIQWYFTTRAVPSERAHHART